jgi:hypothetical protein
MQKLAIIFCFLATGLSGQDKTFHVGVSLESPTYTGGYVAICTHWIYQSNATGFFELKFGLGVGAYNAEYRAIAFPHHFSYNCRVGKKEHFLEFGLAGSFVNKVLDGNQWNDYLIALEFGYRSVSSKGFLFRVFTQYPAYSSYSDKLASNWPIPSIAIGKVFRIRKR